MTTQSTRMADLYRRALESLPGGVSRNAVLRKPHPLYMERGIGCRAIDIDGVERLDFANNMTSLIHGHAHPATIEAVTAQLERGTAFSMATEIEIRFAEHLRSRNLAFQRLRFVNSGTEAVMAAIKAARAFTERPMIAKVEGAYHGTYDYAETSQTSNPSNWGDAANPARVPVVTGTPQGALDDVVVIPFNKPDMAIDILDRHRGRVAAVLIDPMPHRVGLIPATEEFVTALYDWTRADNSLLVFDEVVTFRSRYGGAQDWYPVDPDLTAMGKIVGGGFPVGVVAGRADVMDVMNPLTGALRFPHSGTFSANPVTMTAGLTAMQHYDRPAVDRLNRMTETARLGLEEAITRTGVKASVTGGGSMLRIHLKERPPTTYRESYSTPDEAARMSRFLDRVSQLGVVMIDSGSVALSTPMGETELEKLVEVAGRALLHLS